MADPNQPQPQPQPEPQPYQLPPNYQPPPERRSGLPGWAIALIVAGVLLCVLCIVGAVVSIGVLTLLGGRVSQVFSTINSGLEPVPVSTTPVDTSGALAVGESANLPDLRITVTDAHAITDLRGARPPTPGNQYYAVDVTFENTSDRSVTLSVFSSSIQDDEGQEYDYNSAARRASPDPGLPVVETIQPGKSASGILFYMVPESAHDLFWVYKDVTNGGEAVFKIKQEAR